MRGGIPDSQRDTLGGHPVHRVFDRPQLSRAGLDVQQRKVCHTRLIFAVKGKAGSVRAPKQASVDSELVAAHRLSDDDAVTAFEHFL